MPEHDLQSQLAELRSQLAQDTPLTEEERASLQVIAHDIELRLANQGEMDHQNDSLVDGVNLAVERFEVSHPNTAMTRPNVTLPPGSNTDRRDRATVNKSYQE